MGVDFDALIDRIDRQTRRVEQQHVAALRGYIEEAHRRLSDRLRTGWPTNLPEESRIFREARARELLSQVSPMLQALNLGDPQSGVPDLLREQLRSAYDLEQEQTAELLQTYAKSANTPAQRDEIQDLANLSTVVNLDALAAQASNAAARLTRYSTEAIEAINTAVVNGLISGSGWRDVAREIRTAVYGEGGTGGASPRGGLAFHAETIARTEMISSLQDARMAHYDQAGIEFVMWLATEDERTCDVCASRSGQIYRKQDVMIPAHPRCRCVATPVRHEWFHGKDPMIDKADIERHRQQINDQRAKAWIAKHPEEYAEKGYLGYKDYVMSPFERAAGFGATPRGRSVTTFARKDYLDFWEPPVPKGVVPGSTAPVVPASLSTPAPAAAPSAPAAKPPAKPPAKAPPETLTPKETMAYLQRNQDEKIMERRYGEDGVEALRSYTGSAYSNINAHLRGQTDLFDSYHTDTLRELRKVMANPESVLPGPAKFYRGYSLPAGSLPADPRKMVGTSLVDPAFVSTSADRSIPRRFLEGDIEVAEGDRSAVILEINAERGTRGVWVEGITIVGGEKEFLMAEGTEFRVTGTRTTAYTDVMGQAQAAVVLIVDVVVPGS